MIVQQDFDMMQAEKEEEVEKEKQARMQAEKRAREAEERCKELYEQLMDVKCKLFEKAGEIKAAARTHQSPSTPQEEPVPFTETSTPGKQQRKRNRGIQASPVPSPGTKITCKKLRLITRQKSF